MTIGGREDFVGHDIGVRVTVPRRVLARVEVLHRVIVEPRNLGFEK